MQDLEQTLLDLKDTSDASIDEVLHSFHEKVGFFLSSLPKVRQAVYPIIVIVMLSLYSHYLKKAYFDETHTWNVGALYKVKEVHNFGKA